MRWSVSGWRNLRRTDRRGGAGVESLRELYRIGFGPSSSHTMGPATAAARCLGRAAEAERWHVTLYGSLAATGRGHFTDRAIARVLGEGRTEFEWKPGEVLPRHPNAMRFEAFAPGGEPLGSWVLYSVGGGALREDGDESAAPKQFYDYADMAAVLRKCAETGLSLWQVVEEAEDADFPKYMRRVLEVMNSSIDAGLSRDGVLPGGLRLERRARAMYQKSRFLQPEFRRTGLLAAYATAASEENASLGTVVTAPTCGSAGVMPGVLRYLGETLQASTDELVHALETAGIFGNVVKQNGSISGAEVGCQGEVGVACAMAAAAATYLYGGSPAQCETAAEIGLEHFLGLTCDPIKGLVQIPCIERNAIAASRAIVAAELAILSDGRHRVSFDEVVATMLRTGHDLPSLYRETSSGGLAVHVKA